MSSVTNSTSTRPSDVSFALIGTFDVENFGDCIFPEVYADLLAKRFPGARFALYSPTPAAAKILSFAEVKGLPTSPSDAKFPEDVGILIGGETLSLGHSSGTYILPLKGFSAFLRLWLGPLIAASRSDFRFYIHCVGIPHGGDEAMPLIADALRAADGVTLRDTVSNRRLGNSYSTAVDPVFTISALLSEPEWAERAREYMPDDWWERDFIAVQISQSYLDGNLNRWCDAIASIMRSTGHHALMLPICHFLSDHALLEIALQQFRKRHTDLADRIQLLSPLTNVKNTAAIIHASRGYVGSSLHGAVSAVSFGKPLAILTKDISGKHAQTLRAAGFEGGVTESIDDLPACFAETSNLPLADHAAEAIRRAKTDFEKLCGAIETERLQRAELGDAQISSLMQFDRAPASQPRMRIKRLVFAMLRKFPRLAGLYESRKFNQRFAS